MAKFKVGDKARYIAVYPKALDPKEIGAICTILEVGNFTTRSGRVVEYIVRWEEGTMNGVDGWQLEPIIELGCWDEIKDSIGWNPTKIQESV